MKLDLTIVMRDLDGKPLTAPDGPLTIRDVVCNALLAEGNGVTVSGQEKARRYALAVKAHGAGDHPLDLTIDDAKLIQDQVALHYTAIVVGQLYAIMNGDSSAKNDQEG